MRLPEWLTRIVRPPCVTPVPLKMGDINEVRDLLADTMIKLRAFDERLQHYTDTHPTDGEPQ